MPIKTLENFYKTTIAVACGNTVGKIYVITLPTQSAGYLVISPAHSSKREIIEYNDKGTDATGNYVNANARGVGGTTAQPHDVGEPVRMNLTAEHWNEMKTDVDNSVKKTGDETIAGKKTFSTIG